jgi:hypothetical protein
MNTQLVFDKKAFADSTPIFSGDVVGSAAEKKDYILNKANSCRGWYSPVFTNESKYLPVSNQTIVTLQYAPTKDMQALELNNDGSFKDVSELTTPPQKQRFTDLEKGLIVGVAALLILKLLS